MAVVHRFAEWLFVHLQKVVPTIEPNRKGRHLLCFGHISNLDAMMRYTQFQLFAIEFALESKRVHAAVVPDWMQFVSLAQLIYILFISAPSLNATHERH
jgi:hypothetical protein